MTTLCWAAVSQLLHSAGRGGSSLYRSFHGPFGGMASVMRFSGIGSGPAHAASEASAKLSGPAISGLGPDLYTLCQRPQPNSQAQLGQWGRGDWSGPAHAAREADALTAPPGARGMTPKEWNLWRHCAKNGFGLVRGGHWN